MSLIHYSNREQAPLFSEVGWARAPPGPPLAIPLLCIELCPFVIIYCPACNASRAKKVEYLPNFCNGSSAVVVILLNYVFQIIIAIICRYQDPGDVQMVFDCIAIVVEIYNPLLVHACVLACLRACVCVCDCCFSILLHYMSALL